MQNLSKRHVEREKTFQVNCLNKGICQTFICRPVAILSSWSGQDHGHPRLTCKGGHSKVEKEEVLGYVNTCMHTAIHGFHQKTISLVTQTVSYSWQSGNSQNGCHTWQKGESLREKPRRLSASASARRGRHTMSLSKMRLCRVTTFVSGRWVRAYCSPGWERSLSKNGRR